MLISLALLAIARLIGTPTRAILLSMRDGFD